MDFKVNIGVLIQYYRLKYLLVSRLLRGDIGFTRHYFSTSLYDYIAIFFLVGAATDGNRIASGNLILILAPPEKRPIYMALQINIISFGMFFSILGGMVLHFGNYNVLYSLTLAILLFALFMSFKLKDIAE